MACDKLKTFLDENNIHYITITHSRAFTAQEVAATAHISGNEMAKTVIVKIDGEMAMAVLPANYHVDFALLKEVTGHENVILAVEEEFRAKFPDCELGAMPPFGNLYDMDVFVAKKLTENDQIAFNAGTHTELVKMNYADYTKLVKPKIVKFSVC